MDLFELVKSGLAELGEVQTRPMFGGSALLVGERLVAVLRDQRLYVRHPGEPACGEGLQPFPGSRLRLNFHPVAPEAVEQWLPACRASLAELDELASKVPGPRPYGAYRID